MVNSNWLRILNYKNDGTVCTYKASTFEIQQGNVIFSRQRSSSSTRPPNKDELLSIVISLAKGERVECYAINDLEMWDSIAK